MDQNFTLMLQNINFEKTQYFMQYSYSKVY